MSRVARYDYAAQFEGGLEELVARLSEMLVDGRYVLGEDVLAFEHAFATYLGAEQVVGVNSGTDALLLSLLALGIGPGDEVITQANTFHATVAAICLAGATPVLVDARDDSFLMDIDAVPATLSERTRAVMPVHLYGKPTPMDRLVADVKDGVALIEDAAQAHGARIGGRRVGTIGDLGCFSFHPSKNLAAAGDAGAVVVRDSEVAQRLRIRRELGQQGQNHHVAVGLNSKLDAIQAVILHSKLDRLDAWNADRRRIAAIYRAELAELPLRFQSVDGDVEEHVYHLFQVRTDARDALLAFLTRQGIEATIRYPEAIPQQKAFAHLGWKRGQFPVAEALAGELLCLPIRPGMPEAEIEIVVAAMRDFFGQ